MKHHKTGYFDSNNVKLKNIQIPIGTFLFFVGLNLLLQNKTPCKNFLARGLSGWQDSNLRPPGPKPGAMTGLRYIPMLGQN